MKSRPYNFFSSKSRCKRHNRMMPLIGALRRLRRMKNEGGKKKLTVSHQSDFNNTYFESFEAF